MVAVRPLTLSESRVANFQDNLRGRQNIGSQIGFEARFRVCFKTCPTRKHSASITNRSTSFEIRSY